MSTHRAVGQSIWEAYADADMTGECSHCQAAPNVFCTNTITGRVRRTPCLARISRRAGGRTTDATSKTPGGSANESSIPSPEVCCTDHPG